MTNNAIITVLMALGMSLEEADTSLDIYCEFCGELPNRIADIKAMWWLYAKTDIHNGLSEDNFYFPDEL